MVLLYQRRKEKSSMKEKFYEFNENGEIFKGIDDCMEYLQDILRITFDDVSKLTPKEIEYQNELKAILLETYFTEIEVDDEEAYDYYAEINERFREYREMQGF